MHQSDIHTRWMKEAFRLAEKALDTGEIPVGAIVVQAGKVIGRGYNQREKLHDPTAHAEMLAITAAANTLGDWRLTDCILYVTKEPCIMCAGAIVNARLQQVVFGCYDEEKGGCGSQYNLCHDPLLHSTVLTKGGVMDRECAGIIQEFFRTKRK
ncbi:MAG: tRNA adenosine(34) deaminase TadA [Fidelibacterota bacterium]